MKVGQKAPEFSVVDDSGKTVKLSDLKGKKVVLYFYPKDDTPGCTKEACNFRDGIAALKKQGAVVLGVSADSAESHQKAAAAWPSASTGFRTCTTEKTGTGRVVISESQNGRSPARRSPGNVSTCAASTCSSLSRARSGARIPSGR